MVLNKGYFIRLGSEQTILYNNELKSGPVINIGTKKECKESIEILERKKNNFSIEEISEVNKRCNEVVAP